MMANIWKKNLHDAAMEAWSQCFANTDRILLVQIVENSVNAGVFGAEESHSQWK